MQLKNVSFITVFFLLSFSLHAQSADDIIKKYVAFIGGKKNWGKVKTLTTSGEYNYGGIKFPFHSYAKAPNLYKFVVPFEGKYYAQAFDGTNGWKIDAFKNEIEPTILMGNAAQSMANEADVELENVFVDFKTKGHVATLEGKDTIDGKVCHRISVSRKNGEVETYYFDSSTAALIMKVGPSKNPELQGTILTTTFSDYTTVGGVRIPFKSISKSNDQIILEVTISKAEVNMTILDAEFQYTKK